MVGIMDIKDNTKMRKQRRLKRKIKRGKEEKA